MPPTITLRLNDKGPAVTGLHNALGSLNIPLSRAERTENRVGESTGSAIAEFRRRYGLPQVNGAIPVADASVGSLIQVAATFARTADRAALKSAVKDAVATVDASQPEVIYWLARHAILAGDYPTAALASNRIPNFGLIGDLTGPIQLGPVGPILEPPRPEPRPPELPYPENFYSYSDDLIPVQKLDELRGQIDGVTKEQFAADLSVPPIRIDPNTIDVAMLGRAKVIGKNALAAIAAWQAGNRFAARREHTLAIESYVQCQLEVLNYFKNVGFAVASEGAVEPRLQQLLAQLKLQDNPGSFFWNELRWRRGLLSLQELDEQDRKRLVGTDGAFRTASKFLAAFLDLSSDIGTGPSVERRLKRLDPTLLVMATVWVPLARAELNSQRRQFDVAIAELTSLKNSHEVAEPRFRYLCEFIEIPFIRLRLVESLLVKADAQYKARIPVAAADVSALDAARTEYVNRFPDPGGRNQTRPFQSLQAAKTYLRVLELFKEDGKYVTRVNQGVDTLKAKVDERLLQGDVRSNRFRNIAKDITIPTIRSVDDKLPGLNRRIGPHEPLLKFEPPAGQTVMRETNPRVYALLLEAQARLVQLWFGFNYLGYPDDYVPPLRFQFLLERARYFAEHAKNTQRDFLNFMSNAEHEEFQELSTAHNVEMEKMNVLIEDARVDQVGLEVQAASESLTLANLTARNAQDRLETYQEFDEYADGLFDTAGLGPIDFGLGLVGEIPTLGTQLDVFGDFVSGGQVSSVKQKLLADAQRDLEKHNLQLAVTEANQSAIVSAAQLEVARAGLLVAGLQQQSALLRHEFALQNLAFLRNRTLNAEQWYRLAATIRSVSETYLRYAIELAFLAEQAYEFEADKSINVIRFDYDQSEVGDFLAADFLLRDLDTIEQDLIINQRQRQQQVRYVLSMAREFPQALQELRDNGKSTFSLPLEQLERRFPGLFNIRIGAVDVLPIALMDSTRFSMELTYLGSSSVRLKAPPGANGDWSEQARVRGPETAIFSGLTRQDANAVFTLGSAGQRNAFEGLGAASAWQVDMSMRENQVVPGTLADLLITFTLSGFFDSDLRALTERQPRQIVSTMLLSAQRNFPDAFYEFNRSGRIELRVTRDLLTLTDSIGALRNIGVMLIPTTRSVEFGRLMNHYSIDFRITAAGAPQILSEIPQLKFELVPPANSLKLKVQATVRAGTTLSWDFGDGTGLQSGALLEHTYAKPGKYEATLRAVRSNRLSEYKAEVIVSRSHPPTLPVTAFPLLTRDTNTAGLEAGRTRVAAAMTAQAGDPVTGIWRIDGDGTRKGNRVTFDLKPGDYTLNFHAIRTLKAHVFGKQRFAPNPAFAIQSMTLASNRRFDADGKETTGVAPRPPANAFTQHLVAGGVLSPADDWLIELRPAENSCLRSVDFSDAEQIDLGDVQDVILALEYETKQA